MCEVGVGSHSGCPDGVVGVFLGCSGPVPGFTDTLQVLMIESHCLFLYCSGGETYIIIIIHSTIINISSDHCIYFYKILPINEIIL